MILGRSPLGTLRAILGALFPSASTGTGSDFTGTSLQITAVSSAGQSVTNLQSSGMTVSSFTSTGLQITGVESV